MFFKIQPGLLQIAKAPRRITNAVNGKSAKRTKRALLILTIVAFMLILVSIGELAFWIAYGIPTPLFIYLTLGVSMCIGFSAAFVKLYQNSLKSIDPYAMRELFVSNHDASYNALMFDAVRRCVKPSTWRAFGNFFSRVDVMDYDARIRSLVTSDEPEDIEEIYQKTLKLVDWSEEFAKYLEIEGVAEDFDKLRQNARNGHDGCLNRVMKQSQEIAANAKALLATKKE